MAEVLSKTFICITVQKFKLDKNVFERSLMLNKIAFILSKIQENGKLVKYYNLK